MKDKVDPSDRKASRLDTAPYRPVQGLVRGLQVLEALNRQAGTQGSVAALSRETGLHRTTVKRLLATLAASGFVRYVPESNSYTQTLRVRQLSDAFSDERWIVEVAAPIVRALTAKILWHSDVATLDGSEMVVRYSTHSLAPLAFKAGSVGERISLLTSAVGLAYLAFCSEDERRLLIDMGCDDSLSPERCRRRAQKIIEATRARGYALYRGNDNVSSGRFSAVAVPLRDGDRIIGGLNIVFLRRAIPMQVAIEKYLEPLREAQAAIERGVGLLREPHPLAVHEPRVEAARAGARL